MAKWITITTFIVAAKQLEAVFADSPSATVRTVGTPKIADAEGDSLGVELDRSHQIPSYRYFEPPDPLFFLA